MAIIVKQKQGHGTLDFTFVVILDKHDCSLQKISGDSTEDEALRSQVFYYRLI